MREPVSTPMRIHRVTTRRRSLRAIECPLEPELLVAEFAHELPPEVEVTVREHIAVCETCGARSRALLQPYALLGALGRQPVTQIPDLRDSVRTRVRAGRALRHVSRAAAALGRGGTLSIVSTLGLIALVLIVAVVFVFPAGARTVQRSTNSLQKVPAAAPAGTLFAQTGKAIAVRDAAGRTWLAAETLLIAQRTGAVVRSIPQGAGDLRLAPADQLPVATAVHGTLVAQLTPPANGGRQAVLVIDAGSGALRATTVLALADGTPLPVGTTARSLAFSPDGATLYIGLAAPQVSAAGPPILRLSTRDGRLEAPLLPGFQVKMPMPPPPGALPSTAFPDVIPVLDATGMQTTTGLAGALAISPDGLWLYDALHLTDAKGNQYTVLRRLATNDGALAQQLALPGTFPLARLVGSPTATVPQVYIISASPDARAYILDGGAQGPRLLGTVALGGPAVPPQTTFTGSLSASVSQDGTLLYITQDVVTTESRAAGHDLWLVDALSAQLRAHRTDPAQAGDIQATGTGDAARTFILRKGEVLLGSGGLSGTPTPWFKSSDGQPVASLLAAQP